MTAQDATCILFGAHSENSDIDPDVVVGYVNTVKLSRSSSAIMAQGSINIHDYLLNKQDLSIYN
jgi:hypothetical protein